MKIHLPANYFKKMNRSANVLQFIFMIKMEGRQAPP